ncbi:hypothetical protein DI005_20760 [Prauserella sp. PE36]|nr:hypothetical protein DI005_20760 [Prauserella sp. PE36]
MTRQYIWQLKQGRRGYPREPITQKITQFYGVPSDFFSNDETTDRVIAEFHSRTEQEDATGGQGFDPASADPRQGIEHRRVAQRVMTLTPEELQVIDGMIERLHAYNKQPREQRRRRKNG